ncbi:shikimate dehydrogenase [Lentibacillus sediminis]|uniref:shikimate dehydrogenase n=1 Tax=Lentibacillus sediminis TaxID=1940529 RepID=UPI000C1B9D9F|nr:shikimate dehydrogenase [Lentibacillus sediminis]
MSHNFALIGYPVEHSLSPWIHEQFMTKANITGTYSKIEISPQVPFAGVLNRLKEKNLDGFNITFPYKQTIIPFLDELDESAKAVGAVNTVLCREGKWIGYNTDGIGYLRSLENKFPELIKDKEKRILLIGAGGAARAIYHALTEAGCLHIDIANRTREKAEELSSSISPGHLPRTLSMEEAPSLAGNYDLLIQTTSVGMKPDIGRVVFPLNNLKDEAVASDIIYQPLETAFLKQAKAAGAKIHFGHTMLLYQAQYAFEIWTKQRPSTLEMEEQLQQRLEGR